MSFDGFNVVDTSGADYANNFKPTEISFGDDGDFFGDNDTQEEFKYNGEDTDTDDGQDFEDLDDDSQVSDNEAYNSYVEWANSRGIDIPADIDPEKFTIDDMDRHVSKYYAQKYYGVVDPRILDMAENGVDMDTYMQQKQYLQQVAQQDPTILYKSQMYNYIKEQEVKLGTIRQDNQGNLTERDVEYLKGEVERRIANMNPEDVKARGLQIQEHYKQQINKLPESLIEQQKQRYTQELARHNSHVEELTGIIRENLSKTDVLVTDFSGQAEKDDFIKYTSEMLSALDKDGTQEIPLFTRLQQDPNFLVHTLRLLHLYEKGYLTDLKNKERNAAFSKLSVTPVLGKNSKQPQGGKGKFVDTSTPEYQKKFKR